MEPDGSRIWIYVLLILVFALLKGVYTACEYAVTEVNDSKVKTLAETDPRYARLLKLIEAPQKMMLAFSMQRALSCVMISILAVMLLDAVLDTRLELQLLHGGAAGWIRAGMLAGLLLVTTVLISSLTEQLPKRLVHRHIDGFAVGCVGAVRLLTWVLAPVALLAHGLTFVACKLCGLPTDDVRDSVTEEEIRMMVEAGNEMGAIEESEREMINNIFDFGDTVVSEVMTHRTDIIGAELHAKIGDIVYLAINEGVSRIPVYEQTIDNIVGIVYVKDLLCLVGCEHCEDFTLEQFRRDALYMPETCKCREAFEQMTRAKQQMAVISDEYGGTAGIVTMEDLLEEIVGSIQDEYDDEASELEQLPDGGYSVDGAADPEDILPKLGVAVPEDNQYDTMSALMVDLLGRIPEKQERPAVEYQGLKLTVLQTEDNWISRIRLEQLKPAGEPTK